MMTQVARTGLWGEVAESIRGRISSKLYDIWIAPIDGQMTADGRLSLKVPTEYFVDYLTDHYLELIEEVVEERAAQPVEITFEVRDGSKEPENDPEKAAALREVSPTAPPTDVYQLNARFSFDSFVVGPSNQFAHAACRAVADTPGGTYNPLFIFGGVGLGKTHLINASGLALRARAPHLRIIYLSSESFTNEFIHCVRYDRLDVFRQKYRSECDVLLMDDIQFLAGKERTQTEFFHIFNALYSTHKQIVVTSDKMPQEIPELELRLKSRFQWGLIADIQPPEMETRVAILEKKASADGIELPKDVSHYLATHIKSNVRELEGYLIRLSAMAQMRKAPITLEFAREALANLIDERGSALSVDDVQKAVASYYNLKLNELRSKRRTREVALPRQIAMYLCRKHVGASFPEIGKRFEKDHSTVIAACNKIATLVDTDLSIRGAIDALERQLRR
jgi:chromosomal replication initiator protein